LKDVKESLLEAEEAMKGFQERTGAIKIDDQARAVIQSIAQLRAQVASREVRLKVARSYATRQNPEVQRLEEEVRGLKEQLGHLESGSGRGADPLVSAGRMPQLGADYVRRMRELKFNEALYEILLKQFELAKLDEARDAPVIQIIATAVPPETRFTPRRAQMVVTAFVVSFFVSVLGAFFLEFMERSQQNPDNRQRFEEMRRLAMSGWRRQ
jgi:capsule polysaccharide export protein KpsE/RkpR